jgi:signal transduction histidine kinase
MALKIVFFFSVLFSLCTGAFCEELPSFKQGVRYSFFDTWLACESAAAAYNTSRSPQDKAAFLLALDNAEAVVQSYKQGTLYKNFEYTAFSQETLIDGILSGFDTMKNDILKDAPFMPSIKAVRTAIIEWQDYDDRIINRIHLRYVYLIVFFTIAVLIISLLLWKLNRRLIAAWHNESRSAAFIRQSMIAREKERSRIARDLHDGVIAKFRQLIMQTEKIGAKNDDKNDLLSKQNLLMNDIRSITTSLMPPDFSFIKLTDALAHLCLDFQTRSGIPCRITLQDDIQVSFSAEKQLLCYRMVQEALSNIEQHAKASEAILVVRLENPGNGRKLCICISDDGCGLPELSGGNSVELAGDAILSWGAAHHPFSALGIRSMYENVLLLDGAMLIRSEGSSGTLIKAEIPYG